MKKTHYLRFSFCCITLFGVLFGCNKASKQDDEIITNPLFTLAKTEYAVMAEKALMYFANFDYDAWADMMADNVEYDFPDGDENTRTKLIGKPAVVIWWKNWYKTVGAASMTMSGFNHFPLNIIGDANGGATKGIYVFSYFSNKIMLKKKPVRIRMNFITHFNADKKIDRYITYYDRNVLIKASGKDVLKVRD